MNYNFNEIVDRSNNFSSKWSEMEKKYGTNDLLPMWVADMDFQTAPEITASMMERAGQGVFGYTIVTDEWYEAYKNWWKNRHQFEIRREWLAFCTGVVPAISSIVRKITTVGENVIVMTPVYNIFFHSIVKRLL